MPCAFLFMLGIALGLGYLAKQAHEDRINAKISRYLQTPPDPPSMWNKPLGRRWVPRSYATPEQPKKKKSR